MGWTGTSIMGMSAFWDCRKQAYDFKTYLDYHYNHDGETYCWELLKSSMIGSTWYGAIKRTNKVTGEILVFAETILTSKEGNWFYQKEVSENMGPFSLDCPIGILNLLTPTDDKYALQWRERCRANHQYKQLVAGLWKKAQDKEKVKYLQYTLPGCFNVGNNITGYDKGDTVYLYYNQYMVRGKLTKCWSDGLYRFKKKDIDIFKCTFVCTDGTSFVPTYPTELVQIIKDDYRSK